MDVKEAADFVRTLLPESDSDAEFTGTAAVVVSTISTIIQLASHVQELAANSPDMRDINLGVYGSVRRRASQESNQIVTLFGPRVEGNAASPADIEERRHAGNTGPVARIRDGREGNTGDLTLTGNRGNVGVGLRERGRSRSISRDMSIRRNVNGHSISAAAAASAGVTASAEAGTPGPRSGEIREAYNIPDEIAAKCMSYLLDMSGCTSHPKRSRGKDVESINARMVQSAVKAIFKKHKELISRRGVRSHGIQYLSLVPDNGKGRDITFPRLRLSRSRTGCGYIRDGVLKTTFAIAKADRNRKEQNLALIASLLHHQGHGVDVEEILSQFAREGLGPDGCKRFGGCRVSSNGMPCIDAPKDTCLLYCEVEGERKIVGKGSPDPFLTFVIGKEIPQSQIAMRVKTVTCSTGMEKRRSDGCAVHNKFYLWPKADVGRVEFLGEFKGVLGTAIMVCMLFPDRDGNGAARKSASVNATNLSDAVLLCDVSLATGKERETYPFEEWYGNAFVRKIREFQYEAPKEMQEVLRHNGKAMLWNCGWIRELKVHKT